MQAFNKWLRGLGDMGGYLATAVALLTTSWVLVVTVLISLWAAGSQWASSFVQKPSTHVFVFVFLTILWTSIGILYLRDRKKPREVTAAHDYRYGLTFEGLFPTYTPQHEDAALGFSIQMRNFCPGPIRYDVLTFDIRIGTRSLPKVRKGQLFGYMARGGAKSSSNVPFKKDEITEFVGKRAAGTAEMVITYGHPEDGPSRLLQITMDLIVELHADNTLGFSGNILEEKDTPFDG